MSNYVIHGEWTLAYHQPYEPFLIQDCDLRDVRSGTIYTEGAKRVVDGRTNKVVSRVFKGECAWMDAERLASDLLIAERYGK